MRNLNLEISREYKDGMYHTELKCSTANVHFMYRKSFVVLHDQPFSTVWFQIHITEKKNEDLKWEPLLTNNI